MSNAIKLKVINRSNDSNNSSYVIFQKNVATSFDETVIAWKVIQNLGIGDYHPFEYSFQLQVAANDSWGNYTMSQDAQNGEVFGMQRNNSGDVLVPLNTPASSPNEIDIRNNLPQGVIGANCFRSGTIVARKTSIAPGQKAVFQFNPTIFIGAVSQVTEGKIINSAILSDINTEISLLGIQSADIIITGGGAGTDAKPFEFHLENVVMS